MVAADVPLKTMLTPEITSLKLLLALLIDPMPLTDKIAFCAEDNTLLPVENPKSGVELIEN
tara:strand:- start:744 stop:926 length:183 start_codon:yes stop_codon:yes gene_type:complete